MKTVHFLHTTALATLLVPLGYGPAAADIVLGGNELVRLSGHSDVYIEANNDQTGSNENVYVTVAGQTQMTIVETGTTINDGLTVIGNVTASSGTVSANTILVSGDIRDPNAGGTVTINDPLLVTGATDLNAGLNVDGLTTLDATTIVGTTSVTGATTVTGTTLINTSGSDDTSIGNANSNTTIVGTTSINTTGTATTTIGNSTTGTTVTMAGGSSNVRLQNGTTSINTNSGNADTVIGVSQNTTSIQSTSVVVGNNSDSSNISVGTGSASNTITMGNGQGATVITAAASNTEMAMRDDSITTTLSGDTAGVSAGTVIANNGSQRWIADDNGLLTQVTSADTTSGTTAAMVVTNDSGNTHGLVVQETKTTLSGGTNSASMTLDDRGATFSNPANGRPIQVHGVADGTAPFDAVNVRQLYSGLATVLAAAPDIRLEPGKSGFGVSFGSYGGYEAFGIGLGHMYDNGIVLSASVARGEHSETAAKASISWTW